MKSNLKLALILLTGLALSACAHHRDVRAGEGGVHRVVIQTSETENGTRDAIAQANHFCKESGTHAVVVNEDNKYVGDLDEATYNGVKRASKVAKTVGGGVWTFGGKRESDIGGVVGLGGQAAEQALGNGYRVEMKFKCQ